MNRIDAPTLLTIIYVLVDDWYQEQGYRLTPMLPGPEPSFSDSEMLTFWFIPSSLLILTNAPAAESVLQFIQGNNILADKGFIGNTKSAECRLVMRRGTDARGKRQRGINNQFLITRFSISSRAKLIS